MQFNSVEYIFLFLPIALLGYHGIVRHLPVQIRQLFLIAATLVFYAWGGARFVPLLLVSITFNYAAAVLCGIVVGKPRIRAAVVVLAIVTNIALLAYFKYLNFLADVVNDLAGGNFDFAAVALPLGISFFTFQQIGYLVEVSRGRFPAGKPLDYASFVLFFPQLLAGPIVQYQEIVPQLRGKLARSAISRTILIGLALFAIGLFKKTVVADTLALYAGPAFDAAREGNPIGLIDTWIAAFSYTAQVYFDFSGYSDMAIGSARMFGIVLPLNFHSPLRSQSIVEVWRRWHITLGRWIQSYVFQPLSMPMARMAATRGYGKYGTLVCAVLVPTMIAMLVVGVWHGAGWPFVLFGLMQGTYMATNEVWTTIRRKARKGRKGARPGWKTALARTATIIAFVLSIVPFGQPTLDAAFRMFGAMAGLGQPLVVHDSWPLGLAAGLSVLVLTYLSIYLVPNSQQIMTRFEPVLEWSSRWRKVDPPRFAAEWKMTPGWSIATGIVLFFGVAFIMRGTAKFIYFNF